MMDLKSFLNLLISSFLVFITWDTIHYIYSNQFNIVETVVKTVSFILLYIAISKIKEA